jgi:urease accessory protein
MRQAKDPFHRGIARLLAAPLSLWPVLAAAHIEAGSAGDGGLVSGLQHPISGLDHVVAMVAVGLWGAQLGAPAIWVLPIAFPLIMAVGGVLGVTGVPVPNVEVGIALSGVVLGLMVAFAVRPPLWLAMLIVAAFAIFHGHSHGSALPAFGVPILYASGFVIATGLLHLCGILIGVTNHWQGGEALIRGGGVLIALTGFYFLYLQLRLT